MSSYSSLAEAVQRSSIAEADLQSSILEATPKSSAAEDTLKSSTAETRSMCSSMKLANPESPCTNSQVWYTSEEVPTQPEHPKTAIKVDKQTRRSNESREPRES